VRKVRPVADIPFKISVPPNQITVTISIGVTASEGSVGRPIPPIDQPKYDRGGGQSVDIVVKGRNVEVPEHFRVHVAEKLNRSEHSVNRGFHVLCGCGARRRP
jgi:hypothetical protein